MHMSERVECSNGQSALAWHFCPAVGDAFLNCDWSIGPKFCADIVRGYVGWRLDKFPYDWPIVIRIARRRQLPREECQVSTNWLCIYIFALTFFSRSSDTCGVRVIAFANSPFSWELLPTWVRSAARVAWTYDRVDFGMFWCCAGLVLNVLIHLPRWWTELFPTFRQ